MAKEPKILSFEEARAKTRRSKASGNERTDARVNGRAAKAADAREKRSNPSWYDAEEAQERAEAQEATGVSSAIFDEAALEDEAAQEGTAGRRKLTAEEARERRRRRRSKERAGKMFDRQFGGDRDGMGADGAPRAALYEGKMGSSARKAARMQGAPSRAASAASIASSTLAAAGNAAAGAASSAAGVARDKASHFVKPVTLTPRSIRMLTLVACVVFACVFLYTPAQQYYHAQRDHARLAAEYASIEDRNEALDVQNDILASEGGMEDAVRKKFGYVKKGEETAIVTGLSDETTDTSRDSEHLEANVLSSSVKAPEEWYTPLLDAFFGVE